MYINKKLLTLTAFLLFVISGCDHWPDIDNAVTAATRRGLEDYYGTLDTANLVPVSYVASESLGPSGLGRTFRFGGPHLVTLEPTSPCNDFLPGVPGESNSGTLTQFSYSFLQMVDQSNSGKLNLPYLAHSVKADFKEKTLVATKIHLSKVLGYPQAQDWSAFESCCKLTATCGDHVITEMYQMTQTTKSMLFSKENMESTLNIPGSDALKAIGNVSGVVDVLQSSEKSKTLDVDKVFWSHFGFRQLPRSVASPLESVYLSVEPNMVNCATSNNASVGLRLNLNNVVESTAERLLGFNITIPADWSNVTLGADYADIVSISNGMLSCRPKKNKSCPTTLKIKANPPDCSSVQDLKHLNWPSTFALYIPSDSAEPATAYRSHKDLVSTLVVPSKVKKVPVANISDTVLQIDFGTKTESATKTTVTVDTGDLLSPQFKVIIPDIHFAQLIASPPQNKSVDVDIVVSSTICNDFRLSPTLLIPIKVLVWGKKPGAVETILFELPEVNVTIKPICPKKESHQPAPES